MSNTSFDRIIDKVFDGFKKITPALVAVAIVTGLVLFLPVTVLKQLGLSNLPEAIKTIIGALFLLSCALIMTILCSVVFQATMKIVKNAKQLRELKKSYVGLSLQQKRIIVRMLKSPSKSIELDSISGDTIYLIEHNFIHRPQQIVTASTLFDNKYTYVPQLWLIDLFEKEPKLFDLDNRKREN